ncbi:MAG: hypothetical protein EB037_12430 [Actinobacteria bacterium]|nr:hypothetical protein [Actinomycetota bacterium]
MWTFRNRVFEPGTAAAMVYVITLVPTDQHYVGKRFLTRKVRNQQLARSFDQYWSSSPVVQRLRDQYADDALWKRRVLHAVPNRGLANYLEARAQMDLRVLESDRYLNGVIQVRTGSQHILKLASVETDADLWSELMNNR